MKKIFVSLIAVLAIFGLISCAQPELDLDNGSNGETEESAQIKSDNLDAWRSIDIGDKENATINVAVKGTVAVIDGPNIYIVDDQPGSLHIYDSKKTIASTISVGDMVSLEITEVENRFGGYQASASNVKVVSKAKGTVPEPMLITSKTQFENLKGTGSNQSYVKFVARTTKYATEGFLCNIYAEMPELGTITGNPVEDPDYTVTIHSKYNLNTSEYKELYIGDLCEFTGFVSCYEKDGNPNTQLEVISTKVLKRMDAPTHTPVTFAEFNAAGKDIEKGSSLTGYVAYHQGKTISVVDPDSNASVYVFANNPSNVKPGEKVTIVIESAEVYKGMLQVTDFQMIRHDDEKVKEDVMFANAEEISSKAAFDAYYAAHKTDTAKTQVKLTNFTIDKKDGKYGWFGHFDDKPTELVRIDDYNTKLYLSTNKAYTVYGTFGHKKPGSDPEQGVIFGAYCVKNV